MRRALERNQARGRAGAKVNVTLAFDCQYKKICYTSWGFVIVFYVCSRAVLEVLDLFIL